MSENNYLKNINFVDFMANNQVVIPLIQREYAQGRNNAQGEEVRKNFVPELIKVLTGEKESLKLDFVFGVKEDGTFIPLDGQQRLTTLLLLHWYFGASRGEKWSFSYESRRMANSFTMEILANSYDSKEDEIPSDWIKKQEWFFENWLSDPTVSGMLLMLDEIHEKAKSKNCNENNLEKITFYLYPIEQLDADNAYTKMNARGEPLTEWENIKALLDKKVQEFCFTDNPALCTQKTCSLSQWLMNLDGAWLSKLEKYASLNTDNLRDDKSLESAIKKINCAFRNIFDLAVCIDLANKINKSRDKKEKDDIAENISIFHSHQALLSDYKTQVTRQTFEIATDLFHSLCNRQTVLSQGWTKDRSSNCLWGDGEDDEEFTKDFLFNEKASYDNSVRFFALSLSCDENKRVIRVILNLLDNSDAIGKDSFAQVIIGISKLISDDLSEEVLKSLTFFNFRQIEEEINKYKKADDSWFNFEKHPLLYGSIGFLWDGEKFSNDRYKFFDKTFNIDKTWHPDRFYELLKYYDEILTDAVFVPGEDATKWRKLFKQKDAREAFARMSEANPIATPVQWINFFIEHKKNINNYRLVPYGSDIYDYNTDYKISGNAVRLNYKSAELKLLEIITPSYLCFGQSEAKINSEKCNCNWNENVTDRQRQNAKIKLHETREGKYTIYDDKDNAIGTLILQADDAEKS